MNIRFAVVGGLAMAFYDEPRFTRDIDVLLHSEDEEKLDGAMTSLGYFESAKPWKFTNVPIVLRRFAKFQGEESILTDVLVGKTKRIDAMVVNAVKQPWSNGTVGVAAKKDLITLKQGRNSDQDKVDIKKLKK